MPEDFRFYAVRADSGFFLSEFLQELERRVLPYVIAVRMNPLPRRAVARISEWQPFAPGRPKPHGWNAPRRLVMVRELLRERPEARGRKLLEVPSYTFHVLVTTLSHDPVQTYASTTAAPRARTASRSSRRISALTVFVCNPSMAPKPPSG